MLKKISYIKNLGVFVDYCPLPSMPNFENVNIIYGWNYSGKTTFSRLFSTLESKTVHPNHANLEFKMSDESNGEVSSSNMANLNKSVRVFNSDFVSKNLKWDGEQFDSILILGEEAIAAKAAMDRKKLRLVKAQDYKTRRGNQALAVSNEIATAFTQKAGEIKRILGLVEAFRSDHLKIVYDAVKSNPLIHELTSQLESELLTDAKAPESAKLPKLNLFNVTLRFGTCVSTTTTISQEVPSFSRTLDHLANNPELSRWIEKGLELHSDDTECKFCGNNFTQAHKNEFIAHFSEDLRIHKEKIAEAKLTVQAARVRVELPNELQIYIQLREGYVAAKNTIESALSLYNTELEKLIVILDSKESNPFQAAVFPLDITDRSVEIETALAALNSVIQSHNFKTDTFDAGKLEAIKKLKKHFTTNFISESSLNLKFLSESRYKKCEISLELKIAKVESQIQALQLQISSAQRGREQLNLFIAKFLGSDKVSIAVVTDPAGIEKFSLMRGVDKAVNLSEGEKTAIAFSHFLVKLAEGTLENTIVYIDDPISSLDSNHIFQVNALLKSYFFYKDEADGGKWKTRSKQLFFSTHNFEFFSLLRELPTESNGRKASFFQVRRVDQHTSTIEKLPKAILEYNSEYHFLFSEIYRFKNAANKADYDVLMHMPNAVRRFVELYTYSRIPDQRKSTMDQRMDSLFGIEKSKRIAKVLHHFSHGQSIDRILNNNNLVADIANAVDDLLAEINSNDRMHYDALLASVS